MTIDLISGDCVAAMEKMADGAVDFAFFDPPYNVGKDYGIYKDNLPDPIYMAWMTIVIHHARRISRNGICVYVSGNLTAKYFTLLPDAHLIIIRKGAAGVMSEGYTLQYHSLFSTAQPVEKCRDVWDDVRLPGEGYFFRENRYDHPGMTGLALTKRVLYHFTHEGDTVLDPFYGVGATGIACEDLKRNCIGIELNPDYLSTADLRIRENRMQIRMEI